MNNQGTKPGDIIYDSIPGIQKLYQTIHDVYPKDCLDRTFEIQQAFFVDDLYLGWSKDAKQRHDSEALYVVTENYRVTYDYTISGSKEEKHGEVTVPALMCTDLATVPTRLLRFVSGINRVGPHLEAIVVHDFLYVAWQLFHGSNDQHAKSEYKDFADDLCRHLLKAAGINFVKRNLMYYLGMNTFFTRWWYFEERDDNISISKGEMSRPSSKRA